jgi:hypothetical protein
MLHRLRFARMLTPLGYPVLAIDYCGFGASEGERGRLFGCSRMCPGRLTASAVASRWTPSGSVCQAGPSVAASQQPRRARTRVYGGRGRQRDRRRRACHAQCARRRVLDSTAQADRGRPHAARRACALRRSPRRARSCHWTAMPAALGMSLRSCTGNRPTGAVRRSSSPRAVALRSRANGGTVGRLPAGDRLCRVRRTASIRGGRGTLRARGRAEAASLPETRWTRRVDIRWPHVSRAGRGAGQEFLRIALQVEKTTPKG